MFLPPHRKRLKPHPVHVFDDKPGQCWFLGRMDCEKGVDNTMLREADGMRGSSPGEPCSKEKAYFGAYYSPKEV